MNCDSPKFIQIRDSGTNIPAMAINMEQTGGLALTGVAAKERAIAARAGYGPSQCILLIKLAEPACEYDPYEWRSSRTMHVAHSYIDRHWDDIKSGDVVDVEFILGEKTEPKEFEL